MRRRRHNRRGQALVETAIVLPLAVFLVLGLIQLFLAIEARAVAQYAAARATRAGSLNYANCGAMLDTAVAAVLPTFTATSNATTFVNAFTSHKNGSFLANDFNSNSAASVNESIVWIDRVNPLAGQIPGNEEEIFDMPEAAQWPSQTLRVRMVFWYPLRIPFANWVISRMVAAAWGVQNFTGTNPIMTPEKANWTATANSRLSGTVTSEFKGKLLGEYKKRLNAKRYVLPLIVTSSMRMMTPARPWNFQHAHSPDTDTTGRYCVSVQGEL
jgi:hypothetical protein